MSKSLSDLIAIQRDFDSRHASRGRPWSAPITDDNIPVLLELVVALAGEVGEVANISKKVARGDFTLESTRSEMAGELADVLIYLMKLADQLGIDIEAAFLNKLEFNSERFTRFTREPHE